MAFLIQANPIPKLSDETTAQSRNALYMYFTRNLLPEPPPPAPVSQIWGTFNFGPAYVGAAYQEQWYLENLPTPTTFTVQTGTLPPGLTLTNVLTGGVATAEGQIGGTPTTAGTYNFTLRATLPNTTTYDKAFTIVVSPSPDPGYSYVGGL